MEKTMDQWELRRYIIENYDLTKWHSFWGWFQDRMCFCDTPINETRLITNGLIADKITVFYNEGFKFKVFHMVLQGGESIEQNNIIKLNNNDRENQDE